MCRIRKKLSDVPYYKGKGPVTRDVTGPPHEPVSSNSNQQPMVVTTSRKNLKKRQKVHTWLRKRISPLDFGFKHSDGKPVHANPNYEVLDKLNGGRGWLARLSNADMDAHFSGEHTYCLRSQLLQ